MGAQQLTGVPSSVGLRAEFARALRPLRQSGQSRYRGRLDEQIAVERLARGELDEATFSTVSRPWLDVALVIDDGPFMALWQDTANEFRATLTDAGAFRDIRVWRLDTNAVIGGPFWIRGDCPGDRSLPHSPWELNDPSRRRVILLFSDGMGQAWRDGRMFRLMEQWGSAGHICMVQPLPQRLWPRCETVQVRVTRPVTENALFKVRYRDDAEPSWVFRHGHGHQPSSADGIPIPVLSPEPRWLTRWVQLILGQAAWSDVPVLFTGRITEPRAEPKSSRTATDRVSHFRATASQEAFQLAGYLAYAPTRLSIMRAVQGAVLPSSRTGHLAEVLLGGLLIRRERRDGSFGEQVFEFHPNVRGLLRSTVPRSAGLRVLRHVSSILSSNDDAPIGSSALFTTATADDLKALAETNRSLAAELGRALEPVPAMHVSIDVAPTRPRVTGEFSPGSLPFQSARHYRGDDTLLPASELPGGARHDERHAILVGIPPRNPNFFGREHLLRDIHKRFTTKMTTLATHALHGYGGAGKTHVAIEYAYRYQPEYDLVCWIPAEQPAMVRAAMVTLATRMELDFLTEEDAVRSVMLALQHGEPFSRWLLIFDNANNPEELRKFFPTSSGHILLTSRNEISAGTAQTIKVDAFPRSESIGFLRSRLGSDIEDDEANQLAERLVDLPLALDQAVAWQLETDTPVHDYLRFFDERMANLREMAAERKQVRRTDYPLTVAVIWSLALDRLYSEQPEVVQLLQLCAFFAPEWIPWNLLATSRFVQELPAELRRAISGNRDRMIREIRKYALAEVDYDSGCLQLHRLARVVLREQLPGDAEREAVRHQAHMMLAAADPGDPDAPANWERYRKLWPHVQPSGSMQCSDREVRELVLNLTRFLYVTGSYDDCLSFAETARACWQHRSSEDDRALPILLRHLGTVLRAVGRINDARTHSAQSYEKLRGLYGDDDEETLSAGNLVGVTSRDLGHFSAALRLDEKLSERHRQVFGDKHRRTLISVSNLALDYFLRGDYERAGQLDQQVLQIRRQVLGDESPFTLCSRYSYARDIMEAGQYREAQTLLEETLNRCSQVLGVIHPDTLQAAKHLAVARRKAGNYETACELSEQTFAAYQSRLGADHPDTLSAAQNLVNDLRLTLDFSGAIYLGRETLDRYRRALGEEHPFTLSTANNYAIVLRQAGRLEDAREISLHAFRGLKSSLGEHHPYTLSAANTHANDLHSAGDHGLSRDLLDRTYESFKMILGQAHPYTLTCGVNLIEELHTTGSSENAELLADAVRDRYAQVLGHNHPEVTAQRTQRVRGECSTDVPHI